MRPMRASTCLMIAGVLLALSAPAVHAGAVVSRSETRPYFALASADVMIDIGGCLDPSDGQLASAPGIGGVCFPVREANVPASIRVSDSYADAFVGGSSTVSATWRFLDTSGSTMSAGSFCGGDTVAVPSGATGLIVEVHGAARGCGARLYDSRIDGGCRTAFGQLPREVPTGVPGRRDLREDCSAQLHPPTVVSGGQVTAVFG